MQLENMSQLLAKNKYERFKKDSNEASNFGIEAKTD